MALRYMFALLGVLLVAPAGARAATTFGAPAGLTPVASDTPACCADAFLATPTAPADGVLVRWTLRTASPAPSMAPAVRSGTVVSADPLATTASDRPVRLPMRAGDQIGFHQTGTMPEAFNGSTLLVTGVLEPDADHDGYGDESQDTCPAEASRQAAPCTADIALTVAGPAFGVVDRDTPYAVTVANRGPSAAAGVALTDVVPTGARLVRTAGAGTCTPGGTLRCALPAIPAGASSTVTVVLAGTAVGAMLRHTVTVAASSTDPTPADHSASVDTLVTPPSIAPAPFALIGPPCVNAQFGGRDDDVLVGTTFGDRLFGRQGRDLLRGGEGNDCLWGGEGADVLDSDGGDDGLWGGDGRDRIFGGDGRDRVLGGAKADELHGGPGDDQLTPGTGRDYVWAGPGNDAITARDGSRDVIDCGSGFDRVSADARDSLRRCEQVSRR